MAESPLGLDDVTTRKRAAACAAVAEIQDGMLVGLGTGTTTAFAIAALGERVTAGLNIATIATSFATMHLAQAARIRVLPFDELSAIDLAIDGADELDTELRAIKGRGGAMLREKVVAAAAARMVVIVDDSKQVTRLGRGPLPVEVLWFATEFVSRRIEELGATVTRRMLGRSCYSTDQNNAVLDCRFDSIDNPNALATALSAIPGLLGHGLFLDEIDAAYVGRGDGVVCLSREAH